MVTSLATSPIQVKSGFPPLPQVGDHLALDFLNTCSVSRGVTFDWLMDGTMMVAWMVKARVLHEGIQVETQWAIEDLDAVANEARQTREWLRGVVERVKRDGAASLTAFDVERINRLLALKVCVEKLEPSDRDGRLQLVEQQTWTHPSELMGPIGSAIADLFVKGDFRLIRRCENPACTLWFCDRTKGHRRRWCSQASCGNRAKVAAFRLRKRLARH